MKKNTFVLLLAFLISFSFFGQGFISSEKQWNVRLVGFPSGYSTEIFRIDGDSLMDTVLYNKIWASNDSMETWRYQGLLREDSNVVYYIGPDGSEGILYDFNLEKGDTAYVKNVFCPDMDIPVYVRDVDTVEYFGVSRKRWDLTENGSQEEYWVEGIGSLNGPLYTKYWYCIVCPVWELLCYHDGDTLLYIYPGETECYQNTVGIEEKPEPAGFVISPNPAKRGSTVNVETAVDVAVIKLSDASGVLVRHISPGDGRVLQIETGGLAPGLYFLTVKTTGNRIFTRKLIVE